MPVPPSEYKEQLSNVKILQKIVMENYKKALIEYKKNPTPDTKREFDKYTTQLETDVFSKIFLLQTNINKSISQNNELIMKNDSTINKLEGEYENKMTILKEKRGTELASTPLKAQKKLEVIEEYLYLGYYSLAIIAGFVFLYKNKADIQTNHHVFVV
jgi:hypothetical protein